MVSKQYRHESLAGIFSDEYSVVSALGVGESFDIAEKVSHAFYNGEFAEVKLVYTSFKSMITTLPTAEDVFPLLKSDSECQCSSEAEFECEDIEELLLEIVPEYVGGLIYAAVCDSLASECASRRNAMNSANKNAEEMIGELVLKYNRARQSVITQEITEIVSGAEAL